MRALSSLCLAVLSVTATATPWNSTVTLLDKSRSSLLHRDGRQVTAIVCGADDAANPSPLYIFGHGFDCLAADYTWLCSTPGIVAAIVVSSDLSPFLPDTKDLALDQAYLSHALPALAQQNSSSVLHGKLSGKAILGGHSMGGGTTVLAADPSYAPGGSIDALAFFAPGLYTLPPAYSHRANVNAPMMAVSGAMDCGPNALTKEALPLYQTVNSTTKAIVSLKGANHCQWSTPTNGGVCTHAECHAIDRDAQQAAGRRLLAAFVPASIGGSWSTFEAFLAAGEEAGDWIYLTMNSPTAKNITNNCPCS